LAPKSDLSEYHVSGTFPVLGPDQPRLLEGEVRMNKSLARSAITGTFVLLIVLVAAAEAQTYSVLASFDDGYLSATPYIDSSGNVFGTTTSDPSYGCGLVYELVKNGSNSYTDESVYNFRCGDDGGVPEGGVVMDSAGNLYGTTLDWGAYGSGVVYELSNDGGGSYKFEVIHAFWRTYGRNPVGDLAMFNGSLYGVTNDGGGGKCKYGCGTVYRLSKTGNKWIETVLHVFDDQVAGHPGAGVALDSEGNIYGTTYIDGNGRDGHGTVFKLSPQSGGTYKATVLHSFGGTAGGCYSPSGVVLDPAGNLYGTAVQCGDDGYGMVYQLKCSGGKYGLRVILRFKGANGESPYDAPGRLALDSAGNVYGTAYAGGAHDYGTVFKLAAGTFAYTNLHDFNDNGTDGYYPIGGVNLDSRGNLYGTTYQGGSQKDGTVWRIANP
jgi:uncharacterized repeat protein (TIGR03803 family)